jgi:hypothetical protein
MFSGNVPRIILLHFPQQYQEQRKRNEDVGVLTELVRDFLDPAVFYESVKEIGIDFFTGVPDSLLKGRIL